MVDFITKLPRKVKQHDSIMVVVDKLIKETHFIPVKKTHMDTNIVEIYMKEVARLHGVPKAIVSYRYPKFTSNFWKGFLKVLRKIQISVQRIIHSQMEKIERTNRIIEDMLRMYLMGQPSMQEDYIYSVDFSYNNGYQSLLKTSQFEALYGM
jgi:hypothetical protein